MAFVDFDKAAEVHEKSGPLPKLDFKSAYITAAFEGMHHWETEVRLYGDDDLTPMDHKTAKEKLDHFVSIAFREQLPFVDKRTIPSSGDHMYYDPEVYAIGQARHLYDLQYGGAEVFDPDPTKNPSHETMADMWPKWLPADVDYDSDECYCTRISEELDYNTQLCPIGGWER